MYILNVFFSVLIWFGLTGFLCAAYSLQIPKGYNQELLVLGIMYAYITLYMVFCHVSTSIITRPCSHIIKFFSRPLKHVGSGKRKMIYACIVTLIISGTVFSFPEKQDSPRLKRLISFFGLFVFIFGTYRSSVVRGPFFFFLCMCMCNLIVYI